ncbi:MAG: YfdX family protein [Deltaproteobacteria bacterium]|nr:YfdX family protein [Deltaproteobacteria bacterium]
MPKQNRLGRGLFALGLIMILGVSAAGLQAQERIQSKAQVTAKAKLTDKERKAISYAAVRILRHVQQARVDIKHKDGKDSLRHTENALKLVSIIEKALPQYTVTSSIKSGDLTYEDEQSVQQGLIPVYAELDEVSSILVPIRRAKRETEENAAAGGAALQYTRVLLDLSETKYALAEAKAFLEKRNLEDADRALARVQEEVIFEYDEVDLPLVQARWSLADAARQHATQEFDAAKRSLARAASSLEIYQRRVGGEISKQVQALASDIKGLSEKLGEKSEAVADTIAKFWDRLVNLF